MADGEVGELPEATARASEALKDSHPQVAAELAWVAEQFEAPE